MNNLVHIGNADITIKEYKGQRVVTFKDIDLVHGRPDGTARKRFADNRKHFIEGEDFFVLKPQDLENIELSEKRTLENVVVSNFGTALLTEQGYLMLVKSLNDDLAWEVQRQLVKSYFKVRTVADDLSPQMKLLYGLCDQLAQAERQANEAKIIADTARDTASKAIESVENIKEAVKPVFDNWRADINSKFNRIQKNADKQFNVLRTEMYSELEHRAGCDLGKRLRNLKDRMTENGSKKSDIDKLNKMDVIEQDKKLREIFSKIVTEYEIKYCA